jgi:hypothetical protein
MLLKAGDAAVLTFFSILFDIAVFFLKKFRPSPASEPPVVAGLENASPVGSTAIVQGISSI